MCRRDVVMGLTLPPHGLRRWLDTGKVLVVLPMVPQPAERKDDGRGTVMWLIVADSQDEWYDTKSFVWHHAPCRPGDTVQIDVDGIVEAWHTSGDNSGTLAEALGMTDEQYSEFAPRGLPDATVARVDGKRVADMTIAEWTATGRKVQDWPPADVGYAWLVWLERKEE